VLLNTRLSTPLAATEAKAVAPPYRDRATPGTKRWIILTKCTRAAAVRAAIFRGMLNVYARRSNGLMFWERVSLKRLL